MCADSLKTPAYEPMLEDATTSRPRLALRFLAGLLATDVLLTVAYAVALIARLPHLDPKVFALFDLNAEANPAAFYSAAQLLLIGVMFFVLGSRLFENNDHVRRFRRLFMTFGVVFTYFAIDEGGEVHERLSRLLARLGFTVNFHGGGTVLFFYALAGAVMLILISRSLVRAWRTWPRQSLVFVAGFAVAVAGGVVLEILSYAYFQGHLQHLIEVGLEEFMEMIGFSVVFFSVAWILERAAREESGRNRVRPSDI